MKLTPIFPANVLPVRSGVYKTLSVDEEGVPDGRAWGFSYFDATDRIWGCVSDNVVEAGIHRDHEFAHQLKQWQGVLEESTS